MILQAPVAKPLSHLQALYLRVYASAAGAESAAGRIVEAAVGAAVVQLCAALVAELRALGELGLAGGAKYIAVLDDAAGTVDDYLNAAGIDRLFNYREDLGGQFLLAERAEAARGHATNIPIAPAPSLSDH